MIRQLLHRNLALPVLLGGYPVILATGLTLLSAEFQHGTGFTTRPILTLVLLLGASGVLYAWGATHPQHLPPWRQTLLWAVAARAILLVSNPMQEDDVYRYLWDGRVAQAGVDPYLFSPAEVEAFAAGGEAAPERLAELARLAALRSSSESLETVFARLNNRNYATIYPALAQGFFRLHAEVIPVEWSLRAQLVTFKMLIAIFDLGTLAVLALLLRQCGLSPSLAWLYGACPLVLKELGNSAHMDALPTFFLVAALSAHAARRGFLGGLCLGASVATKFFALLALPILLWTAPRGQRLSMLLGFLTMVVPSMLVFREGAVRRLETLQAFGRTWEMNDAIFVCIERSLAWTPDARLAALVAAAAVVLVVLVRELKRLRPGAPLRAAPHAVFAVLTTAFLVGPLGFPWYFTWCVALVPFALARAWLALPGLLSLYYLRFWLDYHYPGGLLSFESGQVFFDEVVVWIEFGVFGAVLGFEKWRHRRA